MYRKDWKGRKGGGGVMLYIHESLISMPCLELEHNDFEDSVWSIIKLDTGARLLVGTVYRSPTSNDINNENLLKTLAKACNMKDIDYVTLMGDFNLPDIDFENYMVAGGENSLQAKFFDLTQDFFLCQKVFQPTRIVAGQQPSKLDYILVTDSSMVEEMEYLAPLGSSDHVGILWKLKYGCKEITKSRNTKRAYWRGNYLKMGIILASTDWEKELENKNVDESWKSIKRQYLEAEAICVPYAGTRKKKKSHFISKETIKLIKERNHMFNLFKQTDISMYYEKYKTIRNKVNKMIKADKAKETLKLVTNFKESKKAFYGYVRSKQVVRTKIQQLRKRDDTMTQDDTEAAEELLNFFQSVFVDEGKGAVPTFQRHPEGTPVTDIGYLEITQEDVEKKLLNLRDDKAPGPDGLHPKALKELASVLGVPLAILFNKSLQEGVLPEDWKCANVISVFKKG